MKQFLPLLILFFAFGCGNNQTADNATPPPSVTPVPTNEKTIPDPATATSYPSISMEEMQNLMGTTTLIDYVFYDLPISLNLDNSGAIGQAMRQISDQPAQIFPACKAMGRVIFQNDGEITKEADFYFEHPCFGFVFIEENKPVKSNMMTQEGVKFFGNILANAGMNRPNQ